MVGVVVGVGFWWWLKGVWELVDGPLCCGVLVGLVLGNKNKICWRIQEVAETFWFRVSVFGIILYGFDFQVSVCRVGVFVSALKLSVLCGC